MLTKEWIAGWSTLSVKIWKESLLLERTMTDFNNVKACCIRSPHIVTAITIALSLKSNLKDITCMSI